MVGVCVCIVASDVYRTKKLNVLIIHYLIDILCQYDWSAYETI
jgi:hypothetical protein